MRQDVDGAMSYTWCWARTRTRLCQICDRLRLIPDHSSTFQRMRPGVSIARVRELSRDSGFWPRSSTRRSFDEPHRQRRGSALPNEYAGPPANSPAAAAAGKPATEWVAMAQTGDDQHHALVPAGRRADVCPVCGRPNECGGAASKDRCWCSTVTIPHEALAAVPADARHRICICPRCAQRPSTAI